MPRIYRCPEVKEGIQCHRHVQILGEPSEDAVRCSPGEHNFTPPRSGRVGQQKQKKSA